MLENSLTWQTRKDERADAEREAYDESLGQEARSKRFRTEIDLKSLNGL